MLCYSPDDVQPLVSSRRLVANVEMSFYVNHLIIVWVRGARVRRDARDGGGALPASRDALRDRGDGLDGHVRGVDLHHAG
jgi:hypothetical protein